MKTYKKTISMLALSTILASPALAVPTPGDTNTISSGSFGPSGFFFKPYVGADYQYTSVSYKNIAGTPYSYGDLLADSFNGGDVHIGARIHKYLGFEAEYFDNASSNKSNILGTNATSSAKFDGWAFDAMGYVPLDDAHKFELIGTTGVAFTSAKSHGSLTTGGVTYSGFASTSETEGRFGGGAQYWLTDNLNVRGLVRYQTADLGGIANNAVIASLGVNWQF